LSCLWYGHDGSDRNDGGWCHCECAGIHWWQLYYLFSLLCDKSTEAKKERKRHDLAIEELQRAQVKYQHKRQLRLDYLNQQLQAEQHSAQVFEDVDVAMREYWLVPGGDESKLKAVQEDGKVPELSDYYNSPSEAQKQYELAFIVGGLALTGLVAFWFL